MTGTMRAAVLTEPGRFRIEERPVPEPGPGEALVRIRRCGICGTDIHIFNGHYAADALPMIPGHEFAGEIAAPGPGVSGLRIGARVVVDMNIGCGACFWCRRHEILNCPSMNQIGITMDGAFAEYIAVPARLVIEASDAMDFAALAVTEPLACVVRAARKSGVTFGQSVVVLGCGPIGNLHVRLLRAVGAAPVLALDASPDRAAMAREAGADAVFTDLDALRDALPGMTHGRGADIVIESVGAPALYEAAFGMIRKGGHVAFFGLAGAGETVPVDILRTVLEENSMKGSVAGIGQDMHDALTLLSHGRIDPAPFMTAAYPLDDIQTAFETLAERPQDLKTQIVL